MTTFRNSRRLHRGGIVLAKSESSQVKRIIVFHYVPEPITCTLTIEMSGFNISAGWLLSARSKGQDNGSTG